MWKIPSKTAIKKLRNLTCEKNEQPKRLKYGLFNEKSIKTSDLLKNMAAPYFFWWHHIFSGGTIFFLAAPYFFWRHHIFSGASSF
jgi:hypothetical protein